MFCLVDLWRKNVILKRMMSGSISVFSVRKQLAFQMTVEVSVIIMGKMTGVLLNPRDRNRDFRR